MTTDAPAPSDIDSAYDGTAPHGRAHNDSDRKGERWRLRDERDFLTRSLADAEREHEAGDLSDEDHAVLVTRDSARLAEVESALTSLDPEPTGSGFEDVPVEASPQRRSRGKKARRTFPLWRKVVLVAACLLIMAGAGILAVHFVRARQPGQASSGSVSLSQAQNIEQQLQQALALNNSGDSKGALELYNTVLSEDPSNPAALAYAGYIQWNIGSAAHVASLARVGRAEIETAVRDAPSYGQAHFFDGLVLENQDHDDAAAVAQFDDFLAQGPSTAELRQVAPLVVSAYQAVGRPLPQAFAAVTSSKGATTRTSTP